LSCISKNVKIKVCKSAMLPVLYGLIMKSNKLGCLGTGWSQKNCLVCQVETSPEILLMYRANLSTILHNISAAGTLCKDEKIVFEFRMQLKFASWQHSWWRVFPTRTQHALLECLSRNISMWSAVSWYLNGS
jgi:hypothetical protein